MNLEIFKNETFGEIRTINENGKILFCGSDIAKSLGYTNPNKAINDHCRAITKRPTPISGKIQEINFISEGDVYRLITHSKLPSAEKFEVWLFDEMLPTIRETGEYKIKDSKYDIQNKNAEARLKNAKVKEANFILDTIDKYNLSSISKELLVINALEVVIGENKLPRPKLEEKYYTATEIGKELGISSKAVGSIAIKNNIKTSEYGIEVLDKSRYSSKQIPVFRYNEKGKNKIRELLEIV